MATTGSPTKRTLSVARSVRVAAGLYADGTNSRPRSLPVNTATMPGMVTASEVSIDVMLPCATVLRTYVT